MLETKEQKQIFFGSACLVVILVLVTACAKPNLGTQKQAVNTSQTTMSVADAKAYLDYINNVKTDPAASEQFLKTILTQDDIKTEVVAALQSDKPAKVPVLDNTKIQTSSQNDSSAVNDYITQTVGKVYSFNTNTLDINQDLFDAPPEQIIQLKHDVSALLAQIYAVPVPSSALNTQKALLTALTSYQDTVNAASTYNASDLSQNDNLWPVVYNSYNVTKNSFSSYAKALAALADKYQISSVQIPTAYAQVGPQSPWYNPFSIQTAQAFSLFGVTFTFTLGSLADEVFRAVDAGFTSAFLHFMSGMLSKLINQIESNYAISNFLYYSDTLYEVYSQDYLNKYGTGSNQLTPIDKQIINTFIPQFACGQQPLQLQNYFRAKSQVALGFDPATLNVNDPNYYQKLANVGNFLNSPTGVNFYYQNMAAAAQAAAAQSSNLELTSSGLKAPRNTQSTLGQSLNSIISSERGAFASLLNLGVPTAQSPVAAIVAQITEQLSTQFIFNGITSNGTGKLSVLAEQKTCASAALLNTLTPKSGATQYSPPDQVTADDAAALACAPNAQLDSDCTTAIMKYLNKCTTSGLSDSTHINCLSVASSPYVNAILSNCQSLSAQTDISGNPVPLPPECSQIQGLLQKIK